MMQDISWQVFTDLSWIYRVIWGHHVKEAD